MHAACHAREKRVNSDGEKIYACLVVKLRPTRYELATCYSDTQGIVLTAKLAILPVAIAENA
jgi:hypothetical protein